MSKVDSRRAMRLNVNIPTTIESIGQPSVTLHQNLERIYKRVAANSDTVGQRFPGVLRDLSTNGAFITGEPLPLLSRVAFVFPLENYGQCEVLGWTLWRRDEDCEIPREDGGHVTLPMGFGVLFESIPLRARIEIHKAVASA